ncbi:hypothetical protein EVAR_3765_1 [Eumeta japonica]|uniref:Uncharacterized protein n=1 Tax=Eumeta variegata TaxID=151549 RepID=A0A4C1SU55_EUMVA|nr:hypothetical protein EVAR_3765_1 [Eumeta japonica]
MEEAASKLVITHCYEMRGSEIENQWNTCRRSHFTCKRTDSRNNTQLLRASTLVHMSHLIHKINPFKNEIVSRAGSNLTARRLLPTYDLHDDLEFPISLLPVLSQALKGLSDIGRVLALRTTDAKRNNNIILYSVALVTRRVPQDVGNTGRRSKLASRRRAGSFSRRRRVPLTSECDYILARKLIHDQDITLQYSLIKSAKTYPNSKVVLHHDNAPKSSAKISLEICDLPAPKRLWTGSERPLKTTLREIRRLLFTMVPKDVKITRFRDVGVINARLGCNSSLRTSRRNVQIRSDLPQDLDQAHPRGARSCTRRGVCREDDADMHRPRLH